MARIFITGSTDGLGRAAARSLLDDGHEVFLHARSAERASTLADLASQAAGVVIGELRSAAEIHRIAEQVNAIGRMNAVIHNAGIYTALRRGSTPEGHAGILAVNTLAPFMLTALIERPDRLVYLSSGLHRGSRCACAQSLQMCPTSTTKAKYGARKADNACFSWETGFGHTDSSFKRLPARASQ